MKRFWFGIIFACGLGYSADLPKDSQVELITDFSGGLNTASPANKIGKNFSPNMRNVFIHRNPGKIIKRNGIVIAGSTNVLTTGQFMFTFYKEDGSKEFIVSDDSIVLTTQDFKTYTLINSGLNNTVHLQAAQVRNKIWFTNGVNSVFTWDGTTKQTLDGTGGTPNVPKFRYIAFYQERVFGLNTSANASSLNWTDLVSTQAGTPAIAPDNFLAWPVVNGLNIGQGDGQVGTSLWNYAGQLQIGKERSIYTLFGINTASYVPRRTESWVGPISQDSIVVMDDITYFKGYDGIYSYDGGKAIRISDPINPDVQNMNDSVNRFISNTWESQSDFAKGQFFGTTATASGFVQNQKRTIIGSIAVNEPITQFIQFNSTGFSTTGFSSFTMITVPGDARLTAGALSIWIRKNSASFCGGASFAALTRNFALNQENGSGPSIAASDVGTSFSLVPFTNGSFESPNVIYDASELNAGRLGLNISLTASDSKCVFDVYPATSGGNPGNSTFTLYAASRTQFVSDIATNTSITAWGTFDSVNNTNGGIISFYARASNTIANVTTQTWTGISPGSTLNFPTSARFVQWASSFSGPTDSIDPNIDNVVISHVEGGTNKDRAFAISWKNEYWLSVATNTAGTSSLQYVKSWVTNPNPHAWMLMDNMNIRSFTRDGSSTLYGGAASSGTFYRLDYGTNDNGQIIDGYYQTPDLSLRGALAGGFDGNWFEAQLVELWADVDGESGNTFRLGLSTDGWNFSDQTKDVSGYGRQLKIFYNQTKFSPIFRLRFRNNQLDKGMALNNAAVIYQPQKTRP